MGPTWEAQPDPNSRYLLKVLCGACFDDGSVAFRVLVVKHPGIRVRQAETCAAWAHLERELQGEALAPNSLNHKPSWTAIRPIRL